MPLSSFKKHRTLKWLRNKPVENTDNALQPGSINAALVQRSFSEEITTSAKTEDLWAEARQKLAQDKDVGLILQEATQIIGKSGLKFESQGVVDHQQLQGYLNAKVEELKQREWAIQIDDRYIKVREQVARAIRNVLVLKDIVSTAVSANPPVAIVWAGVTVSLLLFIRAEDEESNLLDGLEKTSDLIPRLCMMEDLYLHSSTIVSRNFMERFKGGLVSLYCKVLEFQARALCFLQKNAFSRTYNNMFHEKWDALTQSITGQEIEAQNFTRLLDAAERKQDREYISRGFEEALKGHQLQQITSDRNEKANQFIKLLYTCPYRDRKERIDIRVPGTCEWFTNHSHFKKWNHTKSSRLLWVSANPGCGKSVLSRYLVDEVLPSQQRTICYFFFRDDYPDQRRSSIALASVLRQIFLAQPNLLSNSVLEQHDKEGEKLVESFTALWDIFKDITASSESDEIICVLDALDECQKDDRKQLVKAITDLYLRSNINHKLKFLLTSRPYGKISEDFRELEDQMPTIHLSGDGESESEEISKEIDLVITKRVHDISNRKHLEDHEQTFLQEKLTEIPHRTYLWVALTLDYIQDLDGFTKGEVRKTVQTIPDTVDDAYEKILSKNKDQFKAKRLLHIVLAAERPLSVEEMSLAVALKREGQARDDILESIEPAERFKSTLRNACGLMLVVVDNKVYLIHQTVKEFLVRKSSEAADSESFSSWKHALSVTESNKVLAEICAWHLDASSAAASRGACSVKACLDVFLNYSSTYWTVHFREACFRRHDKMTMLACRLCAPGSKLLNTWADVYASYDEFGRMRYLPKNAAPLVIPAFFGLHAVVQELLENVTVEVDTQDSDLGRTPLSWAAENGHDSVVSLLLSTGKVDVQSKDSTYSRTPLSWASRNGHDAVVSLLLSSGKVDIESKDSSDRTPLSYAAGSGHDNVVRLLLSTGKVDIESKDHVNGQSPLSWAAEYGHDTIVDLLLSTGKADIESRDSDGRTPLSCAARRGSYAVVSLLLSTGNVNIESKDHAYGQTPLSWAAENGHDAVVGLLLRTGKVNARSKSSDGQTPVSLAANNGYDEVVNLLLSAGNLDTE
ncbi:ribosomal protein L38e [Penicillium atrosanguineum]|uniref:ribosomal protein L38e n=1 Tax=Penicillium atrosanguineum TaxID=1132637 RepID=UPI0023A65707|nr:ribosomal protein L38e [Penicillium atrosanguineum]KAJ5300841.1 ribosomal protein L38e [Penicillium atrosanguineum]